MDPPSTSSKTRSSKVDMASLVSRVEALEFRLSFLEKRDKEKNKEVMDLKDENFSLHQEVLTLKQTKSDKDMDEARWRKYKRDTTGKLKKELEKVDALQRVYNRMIVNGHKTDLDEKIKDLSSTTDMLRREMMKLGQLDLENKIPELENCFEILENENLKLQQQGPEGKIISLVRNKLMDNTDMQIIVKFGKKKMMLDVKRTLTIKELKSVLEKKTTIPSSKQILKFGETTLTNDDQTLEDCGIEDESVISFRKTDMKINVVPTFRGGKKITVDVTLSDTIGQIKSEIETQTNIHPSKQVLYIDQAKLMDETKTLGDYGIGNNSKVYLAKIAKSSWQIVVVNESNTQQRVIPGVDVKTTVEEIIHRIHYMMQIPPDEQEALLFNDDRLDQSKLLVEYGIRHDSVLKLMTKSKVTPNEKDMTIFIRTKELKSYYECDQLTPLKVYPSMSISCIKSLIHLKTERLPCFQTLQLEGRILSNDQTLLTCNISEFTKIDLEYDARKIAERKQIHVRVFKVGDTSSSITEDMDLSNTVWDLKCLIEDKMGQDIDSQELILDGASYMRRGIRKINPGMGLVDSVCFKFIQSCDCVKRNGDADDLQILVI